MLNSDKLSPTNPASNSAKSFLVAVEHVLRWLAHEGPQHPKHQGWLHPVCVLAVHYTLAFFVSIIAHDGLVELYYSKRTMPSCHLNDNHLFWRNVAALFLCSYSVFILIWRLFFKDPRPVHPVADWPVLYEYCWLCNVTMWLGALALYSGRPILASALCTTVGIDQLLWYVDLAGYTLLGKFPVGVAKYLLWPQNASWSSRITCTHHLWTIPLLLAASSTGTLHILSYPLSFICMTINVLLSRWMTPSLIEYSFSDAKYLNVNLSHSLWKDIKFDILQINYDNPAAGLYLFRLLWRWQGFNTLVFGFLYAICWGISGGEARVC